jgi:two-component system, LytTR family, response regulator
MNLEQTIKPITALLVDDEKAVRTALHEILKHSFPFISVVGEAASIPEAVREIHRAHPTLVFLDIEMPGYSGLQLLDFFNPLEIDFDIVFVTAYNEYAIQAFKISAFDYLLKPVNTDDLKKTLERYLGKQQQQLAQRAKLLKDSLTPEKQLDQIAIRSLHGIDFVQLHNLVALEASGTYTTLILAQGEALVSSKPLGEFEELLQRSKNFFRAHRSYLINLEHVSKFSSKEGDVIIMSNKRDVPLSRYRKKDFEQAIAQFKI